ncbi:hypothetical protein [Streptomyces yaizuensis]|uniref:Lipoprotein n=1 Tax=Streptomyces yaizuensis TaxID=2989713 RepID=A0ABQ5NSM2_9ACTN|nr:hypothetical protein [Streptomyces sp. YSPA8]GLF93364.1 hypothetical protein SYYSPA8_03725 [Streptomyces sp. YSPA8]
MVVTASAACGTVENLSAGQKIDRAFDKLGEERSLSLELGLDTDAATLKAMDADAKPGEEMPKEIAELFSKGRISLSMESGKPLKDSGEKDFTSMSMKFTGPGGELFEYRMIDDTTYLRADVEAFAQLSGSPLPAPEDLPKSAGAFKKALEGAWVKIPAQELKDFRNEMGALPGEKPAPAPTLDAATQKKYSKIVRDIITREVEFKTADGKDGGERVTASASARTLLSEFFKGFQPLAKELKWASEMPTAKELNKIPNKKLAADFHLKDGSLKEVSFDLATVIDKPGVKKFGVSLKVDKAEKITAPADATALSMDEVFEGMFSGMGASGLDEGGFTAEELATDEAMSGLSADAAA